MSWKPHFSVGIQNFRGGKLEAALESFNQVCILTIIHSVRSVKRIQGN